MAILKKAVRECQLDIRFYCCPATQTKTLLVFRGGGTVDKGDIGIQATLKRNEVSFTLAWATPSIPASKIIF